MEATRIESYRRRLIQLRRAVEQDFQINRSLSVSGPRRMISHVQFAAADPDSRPKLTDLHLQIDRALARISRGRFGQCSICQDFIEDTRLALIPYTSKCHKCAFGEITTSETAAAFEDRKMKLQTVAETMQGASPTGRSD